MGPLTTCAWPLNAPLTLLHRPVNFRAYLSDIAGHLRIILDIKMHDLAVLYTKDVYHSLVLQPLGLPL